ncbi:hypothetical protein PVAND_007166 [Polypedilum vanderplanki]|uniref:Cytochrome P450 n=1 Tax=Polypedilum vanderplanki TaxID=319348 RepID=A0A9J6C709_POLVA|nr:hypothetical protein PVAND_007166 [Polypedilum vanderplanki]
MWLSIFLNSPIFLLLIALILLLVWIRKNQNYFKDRKIPYLKSPVILGAYADVALGRKGVYRTIEHIYNDIKFKDEKYFGIFVFHKPGLFVKDLDIIKQMLITDFNSFNNRYVASNIHDPLGYYQLFLLKNPLWKTIRSKMTPFFSSVKLKASYNLIEKLGRDLNHYVTVRFNDAHKKVEFDLKNLTDYFFVDVIASIAYGVEANTIKNSGGEFYEAAHSIFDVKNFWRGLEMSSMFLVPQISKYFGFQIFSKLTTKFFYDVMPDVIAERKRSKIRRNDLIDTLIELENELIPEHDSHTKLDIMLGQVGIFLGAGYETSSSTASFTLYELSKQPDLQNILRDEIKNALRKNEGKVTYEMVSNSTEMPFLHQIVLETLRMYSVLSTIDRECTNSITIDNGRFTIPKGMPITIPLFALCRDEKYFENSLKYDPYRFAPENIHKIPPLLQNVSFGLGQRNCIGERLGLIQTKTVLIMILKDFKIEANERTPESIEFEKKAMIINSAKRLLVDFVQEPVI